MSDDLVLTSEETRKLFAPPSRAMKCRQMIWSAAKAAGEKPVALTDLARDHQGEFRRSEIYRAARTLVIHGILTREDISWAEITRGKERTRYRYAVRHVEPFQNASRCW
jgi:hypothetical protein